MFRLTKPVKDINGYWMIRLPVHSRNNHQGYTLLHVHIWERYHKKELPDGWIVHHINGDILDNRPDNLRAMSKSDHSTFHNFARRKAETGIESCPVALLEPLLHEWDNGVVNG